MGRLRKVLVCAPGLAHRRLTPTNADDLLFDDVMWVENAQRDHADFVNKLRGRGVEVVELHDLLAQTMDIPEAKSWLLDRKIVPNLVGLGLVAYSPIGRGFLSGEIRSIDDLAPDDFRRNNPRFQGENFATNLVLVDKVRELAAEKGVTATQLALAWVLSRGEDVVPIPGTKRVSYLEENATAAEVSLTIEDLVRIDEVAPVGITAGDRYPDMSPVNV